MSFIGSMLGAGQGSSYVAPSTASAGMTNPTNQYQMDQAYGGAQNALAQQQAFANAAAGQNGLTNQNSVYGQLQGVANGTGPNPAQAMLNQQTGQNVANQSALMAGQRGSGANVGLMARQSAMQGANTQQQAVGQGATMQANQSLNALGQMGNLAGQQVANQSGAISGLNQAQQSEQSNLLGAQGAYNTNLANLAGNQNTTNSTIQVQNSKAQQGLFGGALGGAGGTPLLAHGGEVKARAMASGGGFLYSSAPGTQPVPTPAAAPIVINNDASSIQSGTSGIVSKGLQHLYDNFAGPGTTPLTEGMDLTLPKLGDSAFGSPPPTLGTNTNLGGAGGAPDLSPDFSNLNLGLDTSLKAPGYGSQTAPLGVDDAASTGAVDAGAAGAADAGAAGAADAGAAAGTDAAASAAEAADAAAASAAASDAAGAAVLLSKGGMPMKTMPSGQPHNMKGGGGVPGKPKVAGTKDTLKNDTVPAVLSPGEIVIPRSISQGPNAPNEAAKFVAAIMAKKGAGHPLRGMSK